MCYGAVALKRTPLKGWNFPPDDVILRPVFGGMDAIALDS